MKKRFFKSMICFLLAAILFTEGNWGAFTTYAAEITQEESVEEVMPTASNYLYPFEEAVTALEELAASKDIQAVIYLADSVIMRALPEEAAEPVKELVSGDVVSIIGAGQDAEYNIWYRVSYRNEVEEVTGYLPRANVACVDQDFTMWQDCYVRSIAMFRRMRGGASYQDVEMFPESYQDALYELKEKHPNWIFVKMNTNIDWKSLVKSQLGERSLIWAPTAKENWKDGMYGTTKWAYASEGILKYYLDPRNWLGQADVFQFELLGYYSEYHTVSAVESILQGSFMANATIDNGKTYAQTFVELGRETGVSPFLMATRVRQEQGASGNSALISGTYEGYEGYYNYYNIGASGTSDKEVIITGLEKAKAEGWDSQYKALKAGAEFLGKSYIKAGQDTLYLQKYDVDDRTNGVFWHQYMQNIQAPYTEGRKVYNAYNIKGLLDQAFIFRIPVYNNMPSKAVVLPGEEDKITLSSTTIDNLQVDSEVTLRPYVNGKETERLEWIFKSSDPNVATVDNNGVVKALKSGETTITCQNAEDLENPNVGTCKITVIPADINLETLEIPVLDAITYDPNKTLADIVLPEGYSWVNPDMVPTVAQAAYGVCYNPDAANYNPVIFDISLTVNKRKIETSEYTIPSGLEGGATRELSSVALPNGFVWNNPEEKLADTVGTREYLASYNMDSANYETVENIKIFVKIICEKHVFTEWEVREATCEEDGLKSRKCTICASSEELVLEKKGHLYEAVITEEATEEKEGVRTYTCKNCNDTYTESIPKLPSTHVHKYEEDITKKASCTESGLKTFTCSCEDSYTEIIDPTGHKMENGRCQNCGHTEIEETPEENPGTEKPSEGGNKDESEKPGTDQPSEGGNKDESEKPNTNQPSEGGNKDETEKPNTNQPSTDDSKPESGSNSGTGSNSGVTNNGGTDNNSNANSNSNVTNNGSTGNNNSTTSNGTTSNGTTSSSTTSNNTGSNNVTGVTGSTQPEKTETSSEVKPEAVQTSSETKPETKPQEKTTDNVNQVEIELMSEMVENASKENNTEEKQTVEIQLNKNTEISQKIVEMAKEHGVDLEVSLPNNLKWMINAKTLSPEMASTINMNAQIVEEVVDKKAIESVTSTEEYMELSLSHNGEFGFEATLTIPVEEKYVGQIANLFYFNEKSGELEFRMDTLVDENGNIQLFFNHASDYVIIFSRNSMADVVTSLGAVANTDVEEISKELTADKEQKPETSSLLVTCIVIMVLAGGLAVAGYFIYFRKKEISDGQDFEEWIKTKEELEAKKAEEEKSLEEKEEKEDKYLDDDVDDYQEKEQISEVSFNTAEIRLKEEDYLDDDVDDYQEREMKENSDNTND